MDDARTELQHALEEGHAMVVRLQQLAELLKGRPCARSVAISITQAQTSLLWLGFTQAQFREGN